MNGRQAEIILKNMSFDECVDMWNNSAVDHYMRAYEVPEVEDEDWWQWLSGEMGAYNLARCILESKSSFCFSDTFFFCDTDLERFYSFNTKEEFIDIIKEDFFLDEIMNRNS